MPTTQKTPRSESDPKEPPRARSSPPGREAAPSRSDGDGLAGVMGAYLELFSRPPLGDHPKMDGYTCGRVLAEEYPEDMQRVMSGIRRGVKEGTKAAEAAGGQER